MVEEASDPMQGVEPGRVQAPYGRACLNCVKSKTKCDVSESGGKCGRCIRLNKDCQPAPTVRKRRPQRRATSAVAAVADKTATLEKKLDGIVQLLQRSHDPQLGADGSSSLQSNSPLQHPGPVASTSINTTPSNYSGIPSATTATSVSCCDAEAAAPLDVDLPQCVKAPFSSVPVEYPPESDEECEEYLQIFRSRMLTTFPVAFIRPEVTWRELMVEKPFLWLVVRAICSKNSLRQKVLGVEVRQKVAKEMLIDGHRNIDLAIGTLIAASWGHYYAVSHNIVPVFVHLGMALVAELGWTRPSPTDPVGVMMNYNSQGCPKMPAGMLPAKTVEERRTVVGLFVFSSIASNFFQRIDALRWTPYLDECLNILEESEESPTDVLLVYITKAQLLLNRILAAPWLDSSPDHSSPVSQDAYIQMFSSQLEELKRSVPESLASNKVLQSYILNTTVCIHEHSLTLPFSKPRSFDPAAQIRCVESLWICFNAAKEWFETIFPIDTFPASTYIEAPMVHHCHMVHCMVVIFRLTTFDNPEVPWDHRAIQQQFDFGDMLRAWVRGIQGLPTAAGIDADINSETENNIWAATRRKIGKILCWWEMVAAPKFAADLARFNAGMMHEGSDRNIRNASGDFQVDCMDAVANNIDFVDDKWIRDVLGGDFEYF